MKDGLILLKLLSLMLSFFILFCFCCCAGAGFGWWTEYVDDGDKLDEFEEEDEEADDSAGWDVVGSSMETGSMSASSMRLTTVYDRKTRFSCHALKKGGGGWYW